MKWTAIRVSEETANKLKEIRQVWCELPPGTPDALGSRDTRSGRPSKRDEIGLDQVVRRLIRLWERHAERRAASAAKKKGRRNTGGAQSPASGPS